MIVCIAEKPSVARDIAAVLGATRRIGKGSIGYMEGNGYQVTWTFGHLCTLKEPHDYHPEWKAWRLETLPMLPERFGIKAIEIDNYKEQLAVIQELVSKASGIINCGDAGQEGELIQRWVLQKCGNQAPVQRLWISSLTTEAIKEGFQKLRPESDFQSLYEAGLARAIGDWTLGLNATRLYTTRFAGRGQVLSIGRVQTPTLALIVQRDYEIQHFVPETYYELATRYRATRFLAEKANKVKDKAEAEALMARVAQHPLQITSVTKKEGKDLPPKLFDLTSLQVACNKKFGMSAEETLQTIQRLYEKKLTTYPRVDTTYLSDDIYQRCPRILQGLIAYRELTAPLLAEKKLRKSKKTFDNSKVTDHHAIIPTGEPVHGLEEREMKVFDLIARHFIACFYTDCTFSTTTVQAQAGGIPFRTSGKEILSAGWRVVFDKAKDTAEQEANKEEESAEEEQTLPSFVAGEEGEHQPEVKARQTQAPKPYTEATLLRAMETAGKLVEQDELREAMKDNGIGRPSTRASIIELLQKRGYVSKEKRTQLRSTEAGRRLVGTLQNELLKSAELTGQWEYKLRQIERKQMPASLFLEELKEMVRQITTDVLHPRAQSPQPSAPMPAQLESLGPCPKCGQGQVVRGRTAYGCNRWREGCHYRQSFGTIEAK